MCAVYRIDNGQPFIPQATLVQNSDGSVSFELPNGAGWAGQEPWVNGAPSTYGLRHPDQPAGETPGAYQRFTVNGTSVTSLTRPQDAVLPYLLALGTAY